MNQELELGIEPENVAAFAGYDFSVDVTISNVEATAMLVGVEFKVGFDPDIIEGVDAAEGPFMKDPRWALEGTYVLGPNIKEDHVVWGVLLVPHVDGEWTVFPKGNGTLATITLKAKTDGSCALELYDTKLVSPGGESISHLAADGFVTVTEATGPRLGIKPENVAAFAGYDFSVDVAISNVEVADMLVGVEFKVGFDPDIIEGVDATEGPFMQDRRWALEGTWFAPKIEDDYVIVGILLEPHVGGPPAEWTAFPKGSGTLATITLKAKTDGSCALELYDTKLVNPEGESIIHPAADGFVTVTEATGPRLGIKPESRTAFAGYDFSVDVTISNVEVADMLVGVEFKVGFDPDIIEGVDATEGPFMNDPRWALEGTWFAPKIEDDYVIVGILLIPHVGGPPAEWTAFPDGNGTLATITLKAKTDGSCALELYDTKLVNPEGESIIHPAADGFVTATEVTVSPDVNGDGVVDIFDIVAAAIAFGSYPGHPKFNPVADLNLDNIIDIYDLVTIALNLNTYT